MFKTEQTRLVVGDYVAALQRGDIEALRSSFTSDATWSLRGDLPMSGTWTAQAEIAAVREYFDTAYAQRVLFADASV